MAYEDPLAARYERINISVNSYEKEAFLRACKRFKKTRAALGYLWLFEPNNPITQQSRTYYHATVQQLEANDIQQYA